jgi:pimeloyl-ACP methyl ester carboxylesterase
MTKSASENKKSITNVQKKLKFISKIGKIIQFLSPALATKLAAKIFATPLNFKTPERELMLRKSAKNELIFIPSINKNIMIYTYGYSQKKVLIAHGWAGRGTQLYELADKILENKMMVISFDGPAHGLSSGKTTSMLEFLEVIREIDKKYGPFDAAIGHSFGGMALLNSVARNLVRIQKLVLISTDNSVYEILKSFVSRIGLKTKIAANLKVFFEKKFKGSLDHYNAANAAKKVTIPTLVIHDSEDTYVPVSSAIIIRQNLKNGELLITNGLGHHKIFKDKAIIERIINFIQ